MSIDEQSAPNETRSLSLAELSFAIDAQHDKRRSLQDWYPGCNWTIPQGTSLAICFFRSACRSTRNLQQTKRVLSLRKEKGKNNFPTKNSLRLLLLADSSFAIDAQHDKRSSLQDWYPGCNWTIPRGTILATCFF
jgi:hypothetical protein